jgi:hypothetical protein
MNRRGLNPLAVVGTLGVAAAAYALKVRPWHLRWGATADEVAAVFPGDELVPHARINATHAVHIDASPARVWPWVVQIGQGRGGFYSYDWIENVMGLDIHTTDRIQPELQNLKVGDSIPLAPEGFSVPVALLETDHMLVLHGDTHSDSLPVLQGLRPGDYLAVSWGLYLREQADGSTRLVERIKVDWDPNVLNQVVYLGLMEPGAFIMGRKMLLGIKARAEGSQVPDPEPANDPAIVQGN